MSNVIHLSWSFCLILKSLQSKLVNSVGLFFALFTLSRKSFIFFIVPSPGFALYHFFSSCHSFGLSNSYIIASTVSSTIPPSFPSYPSIIAEAYSYSLSNTLSLIVPIVDVSKRSGCSLADIESYITSNKFLSFQA